MRTHSTGLAVLLLLLTLPAGAHGVITVTNADDSGAGSLREAIAAAAADAGTAIEFQIPGEGVQTITLATPLPAIGTGTSIDGTTQPGASCTSWPPTLLIEIGGGSLMPGEDALTVVGNSVAIRGLVVNGVPGDIDGNGDGIRVDSASGFDLTCSFLGTDVSGTLDAGNGGSGLRLDGATAAQIGGTLATDRNLLSGNGAYGLVITPLASGNTVTGNYIGSAADGLTALGNGNGIQLHGSSNDVGPDNVIGGNVTSGIVMEANSAIDNLIDGNRIGVGAGGGALVNGGSGLSLLGASDNTIGTPPLGNQIANNSGGGVTVTGSISLGNSIRGNQLADNGSIGIDLLGVPFEDANDGGDPDIGPNQLQNTPVLGAVSLTVASATLHATFSVDSAPANATYPLAVDFYKTGADEEEGALYLGTASYSETDFTTGSVTRDFAAAGSVDVGDLVVATATDMADNTSEYSDIPATVEAPEPAASAAALAGALALAWMRRRR